MTHRQFSLAALLLLVPALASAQFGPTQGGYGGYGGYGSTGGTTWNGTSYPGRTGSDGPDLWGATFDPRDDEDTWDARFVTELLWEQALEHRPVTGPLTMGDRLLLAFADRTLRAYDTDDGTTLLRLELPGDVAGELEPLPSGDVVMVTLQGDVLRVKPTDGTIVFRAHLAQEVRTSPVATKDLVLLAARDDVVFALDAQTGAVRWRTSTGGHALTAPAPGKGGKLVLVGDREGKVHALDASTGKESWTFDAESAITASPACGEGSGFVVTADRRLYALDLDDGDVRWRRRLGGAAEAAPVVAEDEDAGTLVVVATLDNVLQAIRARSGFRAWKAKLDRRVSDAPEIVGSVVWVTPAASRNMSGFMLKNGYPLGSLELPRSGDYGVGRGAAGDKRIAMATYGRTLAAFKRITSKQVEDGEEKLPEDLKDRELAGAGTMLPAGMQQALPSEPVPGEKKKQGLVR